MVVVVMLVIGLLLRGELRRDGISAELGDGVVVVPVAV